MLPILIPYRDPSTLIEFEFSNLLISLVYGMPNVADLNTVPRRTAI